MWQAYTLPGHSTSVSRLEISDDGAQAISGSNDDTVKGFFYGIVMATCLRGDHHLFSI